MEQTVLLIKPDGVKRGLVGEILSRFERAGFKIVAAKMVWPKEEFYTKHYKSSDPTTFKRLGEKTLKTYTQFGKSAKKDLGTDDPMELGKMVNKWLMDYVTSGPVVAVLLEGKHAIENAQSLVGPTMPVDAPAGTIRGDLSLDSAAYANAQKRGVMNLVHVSATTEEANFEKTLWFSSSEIHEYKRVEELL